MMRKNKTHAHVHTQRNDQITADAAALAEWEQEIRDGLRTWDGWPARRIDGEVEPTLAGNYRYGAALPEAVSRAATRRAAPWHPSLPENEFPVKVLS